MQGIGRFGGVAGTMMGAQLLAMQWEVQSILMFLCVPALIAAIATVCKMSRKPMLHRPPEPGKPAHGGLSSRR